MRRLAVLACLVVALSVASDAMSSSADIRSLPTEAQLEAAYPPGSTAVTRPGGVEFHCAVGPGSRPTLMCFTQVDSGINAEEINAIGVFTLYAELAPPAEPGQWRRVIGRLHRERVRGAKRFRAWVEIVSVVPGEPFLRSTAPMIRPRPPRPPGARIQWARKPEAQRADVTSFGACLWTGVGPDGQSLAKQELLRSGDRLKVLITVNVEIEDAWSEAWGRCYAAAINYGLHNHVAPYFMYRASKELLLERGITEAKLDAAVRALSFASLAATKLDVRLPEDSPVRARLWAPVFAALGLEQPATWSNGSPQALVLTYFQGLAELSRWVDDESDISERGRYLSGWLGQFDGPEVAPAWVRKPTKEELARFYPRLALAAGMPASATVACVIDADGAPATCRPVSETPEGDRESFLGRDNAVALAQCCYRMAAVRLGDPTSPTEGRPVVRFTIHWTFDP